MYSQNDIIAPPCRILTVCRTDRTVDDLLVDRDGIVGLVRNEISPDRHISPLDLEGVIDNVRVFTCSRTVSHRQIPGIQNIPRLRLCCKFYQIALFSLRSVGADGAMFTLDKDNLTVWFRFYIKQNILSWHFKSKAIRVFIDLYRMDRAGVNIIDCLIEIKTIFNSYRHSHLIPGLRGLRPATFLDALIIIQLKRVCFGFSILHGRAVRHFLIRVFLNSLVSS